MRVRRSVLALPIVLVAGGCGGGAAHRTAAAPPVRAVDEAPPAQARQELAQYLVAWKPGSASGLTTKLKTQVVCGVTGNGKTVPCTTAQIARLQALGLRYARAVSLARGESPRVAAVLRLPYGYRELLLVWHGSGGRLCLSATEDPGGDLVEPFGPCLRAARLPFQYTADPLQPCDAICLGNGSVETVGASKFVLAGTVAPAATAIRVTVGGGAVTTYPLRGPLLRGTRSRVFMTVLGVRNWRTIELLHGSTILATKTMPPRMAGYSDCSEEYGATDRAKYAACVAKVKASTKP
jgi:hypothetical protein